MGANHIERKSAHTSDQSLTLLENCLFRDGGAISPHPLEVGRDQMESKLFPRSLVRGLFVFD